MDVIANDELQMIYKYTTYAFLSQILVVNNPMEPVGYQRSLYSIMAAYAILKLDQDNHPVIPQNIFQKLETNAVRLMVTCGSHVTAMLGYSILYSVFGTSGMKSQFCSSQDNMISFVSLWNFTAVSTCYYTFTIVTFIRAGHILLLLIYDAAKFVVAQYI